MRLVIQNISSRETRDMAHYSMINSIEHIRCSIDNVKSSATIGDIPIGSVEFVNEFFRVRSINYPEFNQYSIKQFLHRDIEVINVGCIDKLSPPIFIKPTKLKQFNGFVFHGFDYDNYDAHDLEQVNILQELDAYECIYTSPVVNFIAEWRLYIINGKLVSACRYDSNDEEYDIAEYTDIGLIVESLKGKTLSADIGLTNDGKIVLVELNDAWAIGKYTGISSDDYFKFILTRWNEIVL